MDDFIRVLNFAKQFGNLEKIYINGHPYFPDEIWFCDSIFEFIVGGKVTSFAVARIDNVVVLKVLTVNVNNPYMSLTRYAKYPCRKCGNTTKIHWMPPYNPFAGINHYTPDELDTLKKKVPKRENKEIKCKYCGNLIHIENTDMIWEYL